MLTALGARRCGRAQLSTGLHGERYALSKGSVVLVRARPNARPRVLGAVLRSADAKAFATVRPIPQFWVKYLPD
jgi:hypothetical protein